MSDDTRTIIARFRENVTDDLVGELFQCECFDLCTVRTYSIFGDGGCPKAIKNGVWFGFALSRGLIARWQPPEAEGQSSGPLEDTGGGAP